VSFIAEISVAALMAR